MATFSFDHEQRTPWNNQIFPGNYVTQLNAYRDQGVVAIPGAVFFRAVGAIVLNPDMEGNLTSGELPANTYDLKVLSPDMRQDDKPRLDRPFIIPEGAVVYRTAVNAVGVREATVDGSATLKVAGITTPSAAAATANADGYFNPVGEFSAFVSILDGTALASDTAVQVTTDAALVASQNPSAGAGRKAPSAIIVEVCYFMPDAVAGADELHIPYSVEAGQGF
jgi:hypothetical protein